MFTRPVSTNGALLREEKGSPVSCGKTYSSPINISLLIGFISRTPWQSENDPAQLAKTLKANSRVNAEGYVNVGSALGLSSQRGELKY